MDNTVFTGTPDEERKDVQSQAERMKYPIPESHEIESLDVLCFQEQVVDWFRNIEGLAKEKHIPFIADARKMDSLTSWKPTRNHGIILGVYNEALDAVEHCRFIDCDSLDARTQEVLGIETLIVLQ